MFRSVVPPTQLRTLAAGVALALLPIGVVFAMTTTAQAAPARRHRPQGPCDIYAAPAPPAWPPTAPRGRCTPPTTARSTRSGACRTTRSRTSASSGPARCRSRMPGGYADAAAQDAFCANTTCVITKIYDQSPNHNDLTQAPRGAFSGPAMGGFDNLPIADMAPITISGHKAYGVFIEPGMGLRDNDTQPAPRSATSRRGCTGSSTAITSTTAAASTTATPRSTAATTATAPWRPPTSATPPPGITGTRPARGS